jgi:hypothetical protein
VNFLQLVRIIFNLIITKGYMVSGLERCRRNLLVKQPPHLGVLELAAQEAGGGKPLPPGRGRVVPLNKPETFLTPLGLMAAACT